MLEDEFYENIVFCHVRFGVECMDTMDWLFRVL